MFSVIRRTPAFVRKQSGDSSSDGYVSDSSSESGILNEDDREDGKKSSPLPSTSSLFRQPTLDRSFSLANGR